MWYKVEYIDGNGIHHTGEEGITKEQAHKEALKLAKNLSKEIDFITKCIKTIKVKKCDC